MGVSEQLLSTAEQNDRRLKKIFSYRVILAKLLQLVDVKCNESFSFEELCSVLGETKRSNANIENSEIIESINLESGAAYGREIRFDLLTTIPFSDEVCDLCTLNLEFQSR